MPIIVDDRSEILLFTIITRGHADDRKPVPRLSKNIIRKLYEREYIAKKLTVLLASDDV
uniref:transposase n=1 Tax=Methyloprofundus sedimenti TaxID=1420851 RepID=UPI0038B7A212